jgi:hypothetical protein
MKYKNIELKSGNDSETELLCSVEFNNPEESEIIIDNLVDEILNLFHGFGNEIHIEAVTDEIINVRCWDITFDQSGVDLLKRIYDKLINADFNTIDTKVLIGIHVDEEWFIGENGDEYNEDVVSLEEFLSNIEF